LLIEFVIFTIIKYKSKITAERITPRSLVRNTEQIHFHSIPQHEQNQKPTAIFQYSQYPLEAIFSFSKTIEGVSNVDHSAITSVGTALRDISVHIWYWRA